MNLANLGFCSLGIETVQTFCPLEESNHPRLKAQTQGWHAGRKQFEKISN